MTSLMTSLTEPRRRRSVKSWPVQDAKARFSEMLDICLSEGPQLITRRGADAAVHELASPQADSVLTHPERFRKA